MKKNQLQKILDDISNVRIAVIGDFCLDIYWFIDETKSEISVETGEPTRPVRGQRYSLGGAGNVTSNLAAMGIKAVRAFGVIGSDPFGTEMVRIMELAGIDTGNLLVQEESWYTHSYAKPYIGEKELSRIDFGNFNQLSETIADKLISNLTDAIPEMDVILINQQVPSGIHTGYFRGKLLEVINKFPGKMFIADSRNYNEYYAGTIRKMNDIEALRLCGLEREPDDIVTHEEVVDSAKMLFGRFNKPLFITRGNRGSLAIDQSGIVEVPSLMILSKVDTVGAGDSYLAGIASALSAGYSKEVAAETGTFVAGVTVQKLFQTGTASQEEILRIGQDPDYIYSPDLADNVHHARYLEKSEIEIINRWPENLQIRHAIFDHDGTISTLREGWELIMAPMMTKAIFGESYKDADENTYRKVRSRVFEFIDRTTGIQTISQMKGLLDLIREFGIVPGDNILNQFEYKKIYNHELLLMVRERENKLKSGELSREDFTLKNAVPFLQLLFDRGIKLYLASGTDVEDVKSEAATLGYNHLFGDRIFGAVSGVRTEVKKIVLDEILDAIGESASDSVVTFGDGPVEIRETRKHGGITVGIASNEQKRFGLNEKKRSRLIKAGADIIVPDFTQSQKLLGLLNLL